MAATKGGPASALKGIPYLIFMQINFLQNNPDLLLQEHLTVLRNVFNWIRAKYGTKPEYRKTIEVLQVAFGEAQKKYAPIDGLTHATPTSNELMNLLADLQFELYQLIVNLGILDEVGMGLVKWEEY
jgi:hypothetical protein